MGGRQHSPVRSALFLGRSYCRDGGWELFQGSLEKLGMPPEAEPRCLTQAESLLSWEPTGPPRAARRLGRKFLVEQSGGRNPLRGGLFQPAAMKGMCEVLQEGCRRPPPSSSRRQEWKKITG